VLHTTQGRPLSFSSAFPNIDAPPPFSGEWQMALYKPTILTTLLVSAFLWTTLPATASHGAGGGGAHAGGHAGGHAGHAGYGGYHGGGYHHGYGYGGFYPGLYGYGYGGLYPGYYGGLYPGYAVAPSIYLTPPAIPIVGVPAPPLDPAQGPPPPPQPQPELQTPDNKAHVHVLLPANAVLWFEGEATSQTGAERDFISPELPQDKTYTYEIKARWMQGGQAVERTLQVKVRRNKTTLADFNALPPPKD
jgi:uncharacterized protein (TIGR03000 family)